jgi:hypothetical protein
MAVLAVPPPPRNYKRRALVTVICRATAVTWSRKLSAATYLLGFLCKTALLGWRVSETFPWREENFPLTWHVQFWILLFAACWFAKYAKPKPVIGACFVFFVGDNFPISRGLIKLRIGTFFWRLFPALLIGIVLTINLIVLLSYNSRKWQKKSKLTFQTAIYNCSEDNFIRPLEIGEVVQL